MRLLIFNQQALAAHWGWSLRRVKATGARGAARLRSSEAEDEHESFVDCAKLIRVEASGGSAESLRIDDGGLLD
jgi:hypothetical protein